MRTRSGWWIPPSCVSACAGGSPSAHTPSSRARRGSGWGGSRTRAPRRWCKGGVGGLAHQVPTLVIERRVEEEAIVLHLEVLVGLADTALAKRDELLALGERAHSDSPFLESDWHRSVERGWIGTTAYCPISPGETPSDETSHTMHKVAKS